MKTKSLNFFLLTSLLVVFSCHSYNKINYVKADSRKSSKIEKASESKVIKNEQHDNPVAQQESQKAVAEVAKKDLPIEDQVLTPSTGKLTEKSVDLTKKLSSQIKDLREKLDQAKLNEGHQKDTDFKKLDDESSDGLRIFLIILFIFLFIVLIITLILLFAIKTAVDEASNSCYVATMAYGDINAPEVNTLRSFRDQHLQNTELGRRFIKWYYAHSPAFVQKHRSKVWLHKTCRFGLDIFVGFIRFFYKLK